MLNPGKRALPPTAAVTDDGREQATRLLTVPGWR